MQLLVTVIKYMHANADVRCTQQHNQQPTDVTFDF